MSDDNKFHGWSKTSFGGSSLACSSLHVGLLPGRKAPALYESNGSINVLAYFKDEAAALRAIELIDSLTGCNAEVIKPHRKPKDAKG